MNIYALIPLISAIAFIPLMVATASTRPWLKQHRLFLFFLLSALIWSLVDYILNSNLFPQFAGVLLKIMIVVLPLTAVLFYDFASSFFPADRGRWLPFAFASILLVTVLVVLGYLPISINDNAGQIVPQYGFTVLFIALPLIVLLARSLYIFLPRLRSQDNPVIANQTLSLTVSLLILTVFVVLTLMPFDREYPLIHVANVVYSAILLYTVVGNRLVDIRFIFRRGLIWVIICIASISIYWGLLLAFQKALDMQITVSSMVIASLAGILVVLLIFQLQDLILRVMGKAFQGDSFYYRQKLIDFANKIHNLFSLEEQGGELLTLVIRAVGCRKAGLLFIDAGTEDLNVKLVEPAEQADSLSTLKLRKDNPVVEYLRRERHPLTRDDLSILPEFLGLWQQERETIDANEIELFMPLISRERLIGILLLDKKKTGRYTLEDFALLEDVTSRAAVSIEKEYLREQLKEREDELSIINRSSAAITSSLDIQRIYDNFIKELKRIVDVDWAAIAVIEEQEIYYMAISSDTGSPWKVGERISLKGTAIEWVAAHRKSVMDADLSLENRFTTSKYHIQHGIRSIVSLPLIVSNEVIGTLQVASRKSNAYSPRHIKLLEQLSSQIAMPIENALLYAKTERMARIDELTGLLNRRSLDEILPSEIGRHSRYGGIFTLIIIDLHSLKSFNDNYGHLTGDELLRQVGSIMKGAIRESDRAFRYGGDEFAILLPQTSVEVALKVAERIRQQANTEIKIGSSPVTISLGLASWPADGIGTNDIIASADAALYLAKSEGGNNSQCASGALKPMETVAANKTDSQDSGALSSIFALAATVDARDHYTRNHSKKVHEYSLAIAEGLGLESPDLNRLGTCALLHDIGKIGISDEILNKEDRLTEQDWDIIKSHPQLGAAIASHSRQLAPCVLGILHHHEKYDGEGYPGGLKGENIPLESRILAIADAYAAMTCPRSYSQAICHEAAMEKLKNGSGTQFDPKLVEIFIRVMHKHAASLEQAKIGNENI